MKKPTNQEMYAAMAIAIKQEEEYDEHGDCGPNFITFEHDHHTIHNPFMNHDGRFTVDPIEYYGEAFLKSEFLNPKVEEIKIDRTILKEGADGVRFVKGMKESPCGVFAVDYTINPLLAMNANESEIKDAPSHGWVPYSLKGTLTLTRS